MRDLGIWEICCSRKALCSLRPCTLKPRVRANGDPALPSQGLPDIVASPCSLADAHSAGRVPKAQAQKGCPPPLILANALLETVNALSAEATQIASPRISMLSLFSAMFPLRLPQVLDPAAFAAKYTSGCRPRKWFFESDTKTTDGT